MRKILLLAVLALLSTAACRQNGSTPSTNAPAERAAPPAENYSLEFSSEPPNIVAGETARLILTLKNLRGETLDDLGTVHEKPLRLIAVSEDLNEFYDLRPEPQADRTLAVDFVFPHGGKYRLYADFEPVGGPPSVRDFPVQVSGELAAPRELKPGAPAEQTIDGLTIKMKAGRLESNRETTLEFELRDAATGAFAAGIEKHLGEPAHFVVISRDLKDFVRARPVAPASTAPPNSRIAARVAFPNAGIYKIFVEFRRAGKVLVAPFVVEVEKTTADEIVENAQAPAGALRVMLTRDGVFPKETTVARSAIRSVAFIRVENEVCPDGIAVRELNVREPLPLGKPVVVKFPKDAAGEFNFTCGSEKYSGKITVQ